MIMPNCSVCGNGYYNREGARTTFLKEQCSRYCYEIANGVKSANGKIDVACLICGNTMSIDGVTNWKYAWMCSKDCQKKSGRLFGRKSKVKYNILKGLRILGESSAKDIAVWIEQTTPYRCSTGRVSACCNLYVRKGLISRNKEGSVVSYRLNSTLPFEDYV
tara:strand:+ start:1985 stop:2470 length:486 start_codon:yes stop_codon:yes gene_type:complete